MRLKLKNTPEQVELIKAMGSKNQLEAREAQEAFAAFLGPVVLRGLNQAGTVGGIYSDAPYDEDKCDARVWLKPGAFSGQCRSKKKDGQFFCMCHQKEADTTAGKVKHLSYNQERPANAFGDPENSLMVCGMWESMACMNLFAKERESCALFPNGGSII